MAKGTRQDNNFDDDDAWATPADLRKAAKKTSSTSNKTKITSDLTSKANVSADEPSQAAVAAPLPTPSPTPMPAARPLSLLICGIGNPGSTYANTLHSAGLIVLNGLAQELRAPIFQKDRSLGNGLVSKPLYGPAEGGDWTLWQSTSYMNESGKGVRAAWAAWSRNVPEGEGRLVIVHDELEKPLGSVTLKTTQGASAKGHNGLKSILSVIGKTPFVRIGIGIGRPVSRETGDVSNYVLKKMNNSEKQKLEECIGDVIAKLRQLEKG